MIHAKHILRDKTLFVMMFFTKVGPYTLQEFERAVDIFGRGELLRHQRTLRRAHHAELFRTLVRDVEGRITVEEATTPEPGPGELLVRVHACALCGSDRGAWGDGSDVTPGHEIAGTVEAVGPGVTAVRPGDRVAYLAATPGSSARNGGSPWLRARSRNRSVRRSLIEATSAATIARKSST